jgi:gluconokinase
LLPDSLSGELSLVLLLIMAASPMISSPKPPIHLIVMGVSGSGKSEIGERLASAMGADFIDGDALHPPENVSKMSAGIPLEDADRWPWLEKIRTTMAAATRSCVIPCSALKKSYRSLLRNGVPRLYFVYLQGDFETILPRIQARQGHFMKDALLRSQFATLEDPTDEPGVIPISVVGSLEEVAQRATEAVLALQP